MISLSTIPNEGSSIVITVGFKDVDGDDFTPKTCVWSLTDKAGVVINGRDRIAASPAGASHDFILFGDDLLYAQGKERIFTVEGTYDSAYMADQPYREESKFSIANTVIDPL
jgi:hypothetical protein